MVSGNDVCDAVSHRLHDACALVPHHRGPLARAEVAVREANVGVADADRGDAHEHLARLRRVEIDVLDRDRVAGLAQDRGADPHQPTR